ncbi:MAG: MCE family protein [Sphingomonadales bacterium]|nr:MCE family protein [Sphingomonadales bacterium]
METRANHVWVGAVALALVVVLAAFAIWLARLGEERKLAYDIFFHQSVDGLSTGTEVTYAGVPAGQVSQIELWKNDPGFVRVRIAIDPKIPILVGTTASIQGSFTGVAGILLNGGVKGAPLITAPGPGPDNVPVIPTKTSGLGALLSSAPELMDRLTALTGKLTALLSDDNRNSMHAILQNTRSFTGTMAATAPQLKQTLERVQETLDEANTTLADFRKVAETANSDLDPASGSLAAQMQKTLAAAQQAAEALRDAAGDVRPATQQLSQTTLPAAEEAIRNLSEASKALRQLTERIEEKGAGSLIGGQRLPDYKP